MKGLMNPTGFNFSKYYQQIDNLMIHIMKTVYKLSTSCIIIKRWWITQTLHTINLIKPLNVLLLINPEQEISLTYS